MGFGGGLTIPSILGLVGGLFVGLAVGFRRGGYAVINHYTLRLILWSHGGTPSNLVCFLDYCARLIVLKKVGGGYIFIHRMLLDYFADLPTQTETTKGHFRE